MRRLRESRVVVQPKSCKETQFCSLSDSCGHDFLTYNIAEYRINELTVGSLARTIGGHIGYVVWIGRINASSTVLVGVEMVRYFMSLHDALSL